eukprot:m.233286 g.233286  ORF g.233286 m.233286 type:complete len:109 (+) comp19046_c0_seq1:110-436(+)
MEKSTAGYAQGATHFSPLASPTSTTPTAMEGCEPAREMPSLGLGATPSPWFMTPTSGNNPFANTGAAKFCSLTKDSLPSELDLTVCPWKPHSWTFQSLKEAQANSTHQ